MTVSGVANINVANISTANVIGDLTVGGTVSVAGVANFDSDVNVGGNVNVGTIQLNSTTNRITGLAAGVDPTDAVNKSQLDAVYNELDHRIDVIERKHEKALQGVAMGFAMNAAPLNLDNGESGISGGVGTFEGEWAGAVKVQAVTEGGVGFGANVGFSEDAFGAGVGASVKF